jgi:hypothetical protein
MVAAPDLGNLKGARPMIADRRAVAAACGEADFFICLSAAFMRRRL